ncbi:Hypothetical protein, putative [Bodo saltans]|uniref:Uncharacterized protein n=1 Tax=Bodo saltans TaxID=75058 RepID=A0A0S4JC04_BODSA|nr:Hypothetical protein, putative [Bodo saltans]|eukprot:CUG87652.1 Hypothetical protein, putative [Bodo saltans]
MMTRSIGGGGGDGPSPLMNDAQHQQQQHRSRRVGNDQNNNHNNNNNNRLAPAAVPDWLNANRRQAEGADNRQHQQQLHGFRNPFASHQHQHREDHESRHPHQQHHQPSMGRYATAMAHGGGNNAQLLQPPRPQQQQQDAVLGLMGTLGRVTARDDSHQTTGSGLQAGFFAPSSAAHHHHHHYLHLSGYQHHNRGVPPRAHRYDPYHQLDDDGEEEDTHHVRFPDSDDDDMHHYPRRNYNTRQQFHHHHHHAAVLHQLFAGGGGGHPRGGGRLHQHRQRLVDPDAMTYDELSTLCDTIGNVDVPTKGWEHWVLSTEELYQVSEAMRSKQPKTTTTTSSSSVKKEESVNEAEVEEEDYAVQCCICLESWAADRPLPTPPTPLAGVNDDEGDDEVEYLGRRSASAMKTCRLTRGRGSGGIKRALLSI